MLIIAVVFCNIAVIAESGDVILSAVDYSLLQASINLRVAHDRCGAAQRVHHVDGYLAVHGADFQAL